MTAATTTSGKDAHARGDDRCRIRRASCPGPVLPTSATPWLAWTSDAGKIAALSRGEMPIFEPGLAELVAKNVREKRLSFTTDLAGPVKGAEAVFIAVGTPSRRGDGHADLSYVFQAAQEIAAVLDGYKVIITKSTVPVGTGDEVERIIARAAPGRRVRRRLQPRVPARRRRHRRLQASGPHRHRQRRRARPRRHRRHLPAAVPQPGADHVHRPAHRRAHQVRGQRLPGDQDHLHQRDRRPVRADRRQRAGGGARHGPRQPHRHQVPQRRPGLRRLVLSQGCAGAAEDRAGLRHAEPYRRDRRFGQRAAQARHGAQGHRCLRRQHPRPHHRRARPHLQAQYRRHARGPLHRPHHGAARRRRQGARLRSRGHEAGPRRARQASSTPTTPMPASKAQTRW